MEWIRTDPFDKSTQPKNEGYYFITDGYFVDLAYYSHNLGWGVFQDFRCITIGDMNFRIIAWCETKYPEPLPQPKY